MIGMIAGRTLDMAPVVLVLVEHLRVWLVALNTAGVSEWNRTTTSHCCIEVRFDG